MFDPSSIFHSAATEAKANWEFSFDYLADPINTGKWALGCFDTQVTGIPALYEGKSLILGSKCWITIKHNKSAGIIDYHVGPEDNLLPRVSVRVLPGTSCGRDADCSLITLQAWRGLDMTTDRWKTLCASHELEILMIKHQIENEFSSE